LWAVARDLKVPLDEKVKHLRDLPYTLSYVVRKRMQIDNLNELPEEKRPTDELIWEKSPEELDSWLDRVIKNGKQETATLVIKDSDVEG